MRRVTESSRMRARAAPLTGEKPTRPPATRAAAALKKDRLRNQRYRLLQASAVVFASGYGQASVAAIVKSAGMSRRTFYEHFEDLTDALVQLYDACAGILLQRIATAFRSKTTPRDRLTAALSVYVEELASNAALARIIYSEIRAAGPAQTLRHQATLDRFAALLLEWAKEARAARLIRKVPDEVVVYATLAGIEGAAMRYVYLGKERHLGRISPEFVAFALAAFR